MRIIVSFNGGGLTINFENITSILNECDRIVLNGGAINIVVNGFDICNVAQLIIMKSWLLDTDEVYFDTRIEEVN